MTGLNGPLLGGGAPGGSVLTGGLAFGRDGKSGCPRGALVRFLGMTYLLVVDWGVTSAGLGYPATWGLSEPIEGQPSVSRAGQTRWAVVAWE